MRWTLLYYLLAFQLLFYQVFSAPTPPRSPSPPPAPPKPGDFVGVRPAAYEGKSKENVRRAPSHSPFQPRELKTKFQTEESRYPSRSYRFRTYDRWEFQRCDDIKETGWGSTSKSDRVLPPANQRLWEC